MATCLECSGELPNHRETCDTPALEDARLQAGAAAQLRAQPAPAGNGTPILPLVLADLQRRGEHGLRKYGTALRANNGRDALVDAYEEAQDLALYLRQKLQEDAEVAARARAETLEQVLAILEPLLSPDAMLARAPVVVLRNAVQSIRALQAEGA